MLIKPTGLMHRFVKFHLNFLLRNSFVDGYFASISTIQDKKVNTTSLFLDTLIIFEDHHLVHVTMM